ncbi:uncharacterized protein LOC135396547 isoform X2 [Ornithodoros turicata]|uniref:uncharacterized protein LOC135396547 isoform X2 n=1 Tax=Ornithodoros turicata TaxID=34597 RepID=UPI0031390E3C
MRWVSYDHSMHGVFAREVLPEDKEFLLTHKDTFKRMWHEQTPMYWMRLVVTLRSFINTNIYEEGFWEKLALSRTVFTALLDSCYATICEKFVLGTFGSANNFMSSIMLVVANIGMMYHIGSKSIAHDPFYCSCTRDSYRELFGSPSPAKRAQVKAYVLIPAFSRFAAAVVMILRQWIRARDMQLRDFYQAYRQNPYWPPPVNWCPNDSFADFLSGYEWLSPAEDELSAVLMNDPDRQKSLQDLSELLGINDSECGSGISSDEDSLDVISALADILIEVPEWEIDHVEATCLSCCECRMNPIDLAVSEVQQELVRECTGALFWKQERMVRILRKAEVKFQNEVKRQGIKLRTNFKNVPPKRESIKSRKVVSEVKEARELSASGCASSNTAQVSNCQEKVLPDVCKKKNGEPTSKEPNQARKEEARSVQLNETNSKESSAANALLQGGKQCAFCGRSDGLKLKRCALCVRSGFQVPLRYCSRECQVRDWEEKHQYAHQQECEEIM